MQLIGGSALLDDSQSVFFTFVLVTAVEVGMILVFRTLTGIGPRPMKVISLGVAIGFVAMAMFLAHLRVNPFMVLFAMTIAGLAQSWLLWTMVERHWREWRRRARSNPR